MRCPYYQAFASGCTARVCRNGSESTEDVTAMAVRERTRTGRGQRASARARRETPALEDIELPDVLRFMQLLWAVVHGLQKASKRMAAEVGVTGPQRLVLRVVGLHPGASPGTLARILHVHPSTLTGVLQRLVDQKLLSRVSHAEDRRRSVLHLTARGARVNRPAVGIVETAIAAALRSLDDREAACAR
jgi:MarR family transcriptional regulator, organic hydroperoxide resistance regulator